MHPATVPVVTAVAAIFNATSSPNTPLEGRGLSGGRSLEPALSKRENNSVDEVPYRIVGLDGGDGRGQQNYFVPRRTPPLRERTQNKRIQQLLNEKRHREGRTHAART